MDIGTAKPTAGRAGRGAAPPDRPRRPVATSSRSPSSSAPTTRRSTTIDGRGRRALLVGGTGLYHRAVIDDLDLPGEWPAICAPSSRPRPTRSGAARPPRRARPRAAAARWSRRTAPGRAGARGVRGQRAAVQLVRARARRLPADRRSRRSGCAGRAGARRRGSSSRVHAMMDAGLLDEVAPARRAAGLSRTAAQALGYKELLDHLDGRCSLDEAVELIVTRTRQFAVRQERWFRRDPRVRWIDVDARPGRRAAPDRARRARRDCVMTTLTLTKHHGLGNDFLVAFRPAAARGRPAGARPAGCATGDAASAPTDCWSARPSRRLRRADGAVQRRRQPGRDERQRHPLLRPGARRAPRRPRRRSGSSPTPATGVVDAQGHRRARHDPRQRSTWARSSRSPSPTAGTRSAVIPIGPSPTSASATRTASSASTTSASSISLALGRKVPHVNLEIVEAGPSTSTRSRMRVHERGAGITEACGTGACAAAFAAAPLGTGDAARRETRGAHGRRSCHSDARRPDDPGGSR